MSTSFEHLQAIQAAARVIDERAVTLQAALPRAAAQFQSLAYELLDVLDAAAEATQEKSLELPSPPRPPAPAENAVF